ncbi:hypothetical protein BBP40_009845 [Aspergillus hancockii]|nr:hypothetical protein BBP40_009845 [Aspergillus hancockii]
MSVSRHPLISLSHSDPSLGQQSISSEPDQQGPPGYDSQRPAMAKRRMDIITSEDASSKNRLFYFVDSNSSSREKRAHVMRHHVQEKRKQLKHSYPRSNSDRKGNRPPYYLSWQQKLLISGEDSEFIKYEKPAKEASSSSSQVELQPGSSPVSPVTILDASPKDPFNSLPVLCTREDFELVDFWTNRLSYWSGQNRLIKEQVFRASGPSVVFSNNHSLIFCSFKGAGQAKKGIEEVMRGAMKIDTDDLAWALSGMAIHEDRFGIKQQAIRYADQAVQILRSSGGSNRLAETFLHYVQYMITPLHPVVPEDGQQWLVTFLRGAEELMLEHNTVAYLSSVPQRRSAFKMDSPLFPFAIERTSSFPNSAGFPHIRSALWDFQGSPSKTCRYLDCLHTIAKEHELDRYPASETFVWLLLQEPYDSDLQEPERSWSTGELLKMHKQLRTDLQFHFNEILLSFLMLTPPVRGVDLFKKELSISMPDILVEP